MNNVSKSRKRKRRKITKIFALCLLIVIIILFATIFYLNIIPILITIILFILALFSILGLSLLNFSKIRGIRYIGYLLSTLLILLSLFIEIYLVNTLGFLFNATNGGYLTKNYNVVVLSDSNYSKIDDLDNKKLGYYNVDNLKNIKKKLKKVDLTYQELNSKDELINGLLNNKIEAIILENSELTLLEENDSNTYNKLKVIYTIEIKLNINNVKNAINITKEPFNIYVSGIDTYGSISDVSRSDVNILVSVNPKLGKIIITWIPRDYYIDIGKGTKDKLTHAGMYGIDYSILAIEKLLDVDINYYVKVNFTSVVKLVDLLGGLEIYNDETFTTNDNFTFNKGNLTLNGEEALSFVRDRKHVTGGDIGRGKNQVKVMKALFNKVLSKNLLKNYNKLLKSLEGTFVTNLEQSNITNFVKWQLLKRKKWEFDSIILNGTDGREYTYSVSSQTLYVMLPDEEMVNNAKTKIKEIISK